MPEHVSDDLPGNWRWSPGEASRPLSERGYYLHVATLVVWENQHARRYYEARIDTAGMPPQQHVLDIRLREENYNRGDSVDIKHCVTDGLDVSDPSDEEAQETAEERIHEKARMHMDYYAGDGA